MGIRISYPLVHEPIRYSDDSEDDEASGIAAQQIHEINLKYCEDMIQQRQRSMEAQKKFDDFEIQREGKTAEILKKYPKWEVEDIANLKLQFQMFDSNMDYLLDFEELNTALTNCGDDSTEEERKKHFVEIDKDGSGSIDFEEYLEMMYSMNSMKHGTRNSELSTKLNSAIRGNELVGTITKMDTYQQMCYKLF